MTEQPETEPEVLSIRYVADLAGLTPSMLRTWELRLGWPNPKRLDNGYRSYDKQLIDDITHAGDMVARGIPIERLVSGGVYLGRNTANNPAKLRCTLVGIELPIPSHPESVTIQRAVVAAIERVSSDVLLMVQDSELVHADDRESTILMPAALWIARTQATRVPGASADLARRLSLTLHATLGRRAMGELFARAATIVGDSETDLARLDALIGPLDEMPAPAVSTGIHDAISDTYINTACVPDSTPIGDDIPHVLPARIDRGSVIIMDADPESTDMRDALDDAEAEDRCVLVVIPDAEVPRLGAKVDLHALARQIGVRDALTDRLIVLAFDANQIRRSQAIESFLKARAANNPDRLSEFVSRINNG